MMHRGGQAARSANVAEKSQDVEHIVIYSVEILCCGLRCLFVVVDIGVV